MAKFEMNNADARKIGRNIANAGKDALAFIVASSEHITSEGDWTIAESFLDSLPEGADKAHARKIYGRIFDGRVVLVKDKDRASGIRFKVDKTKVNGTFTDIVLDGPVWTGLKSAVESGKSWRSKDVNEAIGRPPSEFDLDKTGERFLKRAVSEAGIDATEKELRALMAKVQEMRAEAQISAAPKGEGGLG